MNSINGKAYNKLLEIVLTYNKMNYETIKNFYNGNFGTGYILRKETSKYIYFVTLEYNINFSVDEIKIEIDKRNKMNETIDYKKSYEKI